MDDEALRIAAGLPEGFFEVHRGLEREGPGAPEDVQTVDIRSRAV